MYIHNTTNLGRYPMNQMHSIVPANLLIAERTALVSCRVVRRACVNVPPRTVTQYSPNHAMSSIKSRHPPEHR